MSSPTMAPLSVDLMRASEMCGYSVKTLRRAIDAGKLRAVRATVKVVIMVDDLRAYLEASRIVPELPASKSVKKHFKGTKVDSGGQERTRNREK